MRARLIDWNNNGSSTSCHSVVVCGLDEQGWGGGIERGAEISTEIATIWRPRGKKIKVAECSKKRQQQIR